MGTLLKNKTKERVLEFNWPTLVVDDFPHCCGVQVVSGFPQDKEDFLNAVASIENDDFDTAFKDVTATFEEAKKRLSASLDDAINPRQATFATLNAEQIKAGVGQALIELGFVALYSFKSGTTGNGITIYLKPPTQKYQKSRY